MSRPVTPPNQSPVRTEADIIKRARFFEAWDSRPPNQSIRAFAKLHGFSFSTTRYWVRQRQSLGSLAYRRTRKRSTRLGRKRKISDKDINKLLSPSNPVRKQHYEHQIDHFNLNCKPRTVQRTLHFYTKGARRFKAVRVKAISKANKAKRIQYGRDHKDKSIEDFWQYILFTDEAHIDPSEVFTEYILRAPGTAYNPENLQERPEKKGVKLHIAA